MALNREDKKILKTILMLAYCVEGYKMSEIDRAEQTKKSLGLDYFTIYSDEYKIIKTNLQDAGLKKIYQDFVGKLLSYHILRTEQNFITFKSTDMLDIKILYNNALEKVLVYTNKNKGNSAETVEEFTIDNLKALNNEVKKKFDPRHISIIFRTFTKGNNSLVIHAISGEEITVTVTSKGWDVSSSSDIGYEGENLEELLEVFYRSNIDEILHGAQTIKQEELKEVITSVNKNLKCSFVPVKGDDWSFYCYVYSGAIELSLLTFTFKSLKEKTLKMIDKIDFTESKTIKTNAGWEKTVKQFIKSLLSKISKVEQNYIQKLLDEVTLFKCETESSDDWGLVKSHNVSVLYVTRKEIIARDGKIFNIKGNDLLADIKTIKAACSYVDRNDLYALKQPKWNF